MIVQVTTRIDKATKQKFDKICKQIGVSPSNALSMFVSGVINHNGMPFQSVVFPKQPIKTLKKAAVRPPFEFDSMAGEVVMADDFDAPMDDFKEYME